MDKNYKKQNNKKNAPDFDNEDDLYDPLTGKKLIPHNKSKKKAKKKFLNINSEYAVFYIVTLIIAVIVSVILFVAMFSRVRVDIPDPDTGIEMDDSLDDMLLAENEVTILGVVQNINTVSRVLHIYDITTRNTILLNVEGSTDLRDRFGQGLVFAEISQGDIVNATYDTTNNTLSSLSISNDTWERRFVSGLEINENNKTITMGNDTFNYTDQIQILNNGENYSIANLHPLNIVTMRGINNTVWFIEVEKGFGTVNVINSNQIKNGSMEIGRSISIPIGEQADPNSQYANIQEGTHRITVRGSNIAPYTREINVNNGETTIVDLSTIPLTSGTLTITTNVPATVTINGSQVDITEPIPLNFGQYAIAAQSPGYYPYESTLAVNNPNQQLEITLLPETVNGTIEITSIPAGADVFIDNTSIGITPITATVEQGIRNLTIRKEGFITVEMPVDVSSRSRPISIELQPTIEPTPSLDLTPSTSTPPTVDSDDLTFIPGPGQ